jgi:translation initiation factor 5B
MEAYIEDLKFDLSKINITAEFYHKNKKLNTVYSIVPVSSKTREGLSDILALIVYISQNMMKNKLSYELSHNNTFECTVMNCLQHEDMWVIDCILKNGQIKIGDKFVVAGDEGEKIITVRNLYIHNTNNLTMIQHIIASAGVRIICSNAEGTYIGVKLHLIDNTNDAYVLAQNEMKEYWSKYTMNENGIVIMAPTFGELDAMYKMYSENKIMISQMLVGYIKEKHIKRILPLLTEMNKMYRVIVYFGDLSLQYQDELTLILKKYDCILISSPVIFQTIEQVNKYMCDCVQEQTDTGIQNIQKQIKSGKIIYPCELQILNECVFMKGGNRDFIIGVKILDGILYKNTLLSCNKLIIGRVINIEKDKKQQDSAIKNDEVCIRIENKQKYTYMKQFNDSHHMISTLNRNSIDSLKQYYRTEMKSTDWELIVKHMKILNIPLLH